ncbi:MAG TPA: hypothetical protein VKG01_16300 [Thermoanaerobaculia bacterium]|nr:hypothetical protein [Thermoanaerobaculia bacterium]
MKSAQLPARAPERLPEPAPAPRAAWPRPAKKPTRFVIKIVGQVPF